MSAAAGGPSAPRVPSAPFARGAVSVRLYGHGGSAAEVLGAFREQAELAAAGGFDGITVSEHHGGFAGYLPNPLQLTTWLLEWCPHVWAAPCPMLLPLRPAGLVAEENAWLSARHAGRVGLAVAAGSLGQDFDIAGIELGTGATGTGVAGTGSAAAASDLTARFAAGLATVAGALAGRATGPLAQDAAVAATAEHPVPVLSAAMSATAARRAAALGVGIALDSISSREHLRTVVDAYVAAGGTGPRLLTRWVWLGEPPAPAVGAQLAAYRAYTPADRVARWPAVPDVVSGTPEQVVEGLRAALGETGATCLNLRVHLAGVAPATATAQLAALGRHVLPHLLHGAPAA